MAHQEWYYCQDGKTPIGPVSAWQLRKLAQAGKIAPTDTVWIEFKKKWVPASRVKELFPIQSPASEPVPAPADSQTVLQTAPTEETATIQQWFYNRDGKTIIGPVSASHDEKACQSGISSSHRYGPVGGHREMDSRTQSPEAVSGWTTRSGRCRRRPLSALLACLPLRLVSSRNLPRYRPKRRKLLKNGFTVRTPEPFSVQFLGLGCNNLQKREGSFPRTGCGRRIWRIGFLQALSPICSRQSRLAQKRSHFLPRKSRTLSNTALHRSSRRLLLCRPHYLFPFLRYRFRPTTQHILPRISQMARRFSGIQGSRPVGASCLHGALVLL